ncbi:MAG: hypothetical protein ACOYEC_04735 [Christensenellales bacterium]|jgi:hypothetical protein|nr:hypothetical protein [Clostridiales bacterium]
MENKVKKEFITLFEKTDKKAVYTILWMTVISFLYLISIHSFPFFSKIALKTQLDSWQRGYYRDIYKNFLSFALLFAATALFSKLVLKRQIKETGLLLKKEYRRSNIILTFIALAILLYISFLNVWDAIYRGTHVWSGRIFNLSAGYAALYYFSCLAFWFGMEYLFRGMGFFNISNRYGPAMAISITTMASSFTLIAMPGFATADALSIIVIAQEIALGYITYKAKTIYPAFFARFLRILCWDILSALMC